VLAVLVGTVEASNRRHHSRRIASITVTPEGSGSLLAVTFAGRGQPHLLRTQDRISAYTVADVDNDGDLDILAASSGQGLLLWRNLGRGRFAVATLPPARAPAQPRVGLRRVGHADEGFVAADERYDAAMPRAPGALAPVSVDAVFNAFIAFAPPTPVVRRSGRAPPSPLA